MTHLESKLSEMADIHMGTVTFGDAHNMPFTTTRKSFESGFLAALSLPELAELVRSLQFIANGCLVPPDGGSPDLQDAVHEANAALAKWNEFVGGGE